MIRPVIHLVLHLVVPLEVARWLFPARWKRAWLIMILAMAVDLDHLWADPIYDPNRCGIGFHPLHSYPAMTVYIAMTAVAQTRVLGVGLVIHMLLDGLDCVWMALG